MRLRATFPVYRARNRSLKDNLTDYGSVEEYLVSKARDRRNLLAIKPATCITTENNSKLCNGTIDHDKCTACLACQIGLAQPEDGVDEFGMPSADVIYSYEGLSKEFFQGKFISHPTTSSKARPIIGRFDEYTGRIDERDFTNPLAACYLWEMSVGNAYVSCSPGHELSLDCSIYSGEREGHLDITLRTIYKEKKYLFVGEGKCNVASLLRDSIREQQRKYERQIVALGDKHDYRSLFSYVVGGNEEPMYPPNVPGVPKNVLNRGKFFYDIFRNKKRFISIHALRGLGVLFIASKGSLGIENTLFPLFENEDVVGLVLGGVIQLRNRQFTIGKLDDFITIR